MTDLRTAAEMTRRQPMLDVRDLRTLIPTGRGLVRAVDGVDFTVRPGEVVGLVGESGSGKSVCCRTIMGLMPSSAQISGEILFRSSPDAEPQDLIGLSGKRRRELWGSQLSMVFQDPMTAFNPVVRIGRQLTEAVKAHADYGRGECEAEAIRLLEMVGVPAARRRMEDYPHQFSGGMLQRALIAIALASKPRLLFADEPTTSLDVVIQDQILDLLLELQRELGMSVVLVSHDLSVVSEVCDRVMVMYAGQVVETTDTDRLLEMPTHPYTVGLLQSLPKTAADSKYLPSIKGAPPDMIAVPPGCRFSPRCALVEDECREWESELLPVAGAPVPHAARCRRQDAVPAWRGESSGQPVGEPTL